jgi:hypothetical protein
MGIAVDGNDNIYVTEAGNTRVQKFQTLPLTGDPVCPACGNGIVETGEVCDDGVNNGLT